jgi:hypothetical protein
MKLTESQIKELVSYLFSHWKTQGLVTFKESESRVYEQACEVLRKDQNQILHFEKEVRSLLESLESQAPSGFDRHKMYHLLRQRLAKEKGIIL